MSELTREQMLTVRTQHLVGKRVVIKEVADPVVPQYSFAIGKKGRDYIITNYQIAHLKIEHGIDAAKLRRHRPYMTDIDYQRVKTAYAKGGR